MPVDLEELVRQLKAENNSFRGNFEEVRRVSMRWIVVDDVNDHDDDVHDDDVNDDAAANDER